MQKATQLICDNYKDNKKILKRKLMRVCTLRTTTDAQSQIKSSENSFSNARVDILVQEKGRKPNNNNKENDMQIWFYPVLNSLQKLSKGSLSWYKVLPYCSVTVNEIMS